MTELDAVITTAEIIRSGRVDLSERKRVRVENRQRDAIDVVRVPDRMVVVLTVVVLIVVVQIHLNAARE
jgi:hypothetical protein